MDLDYSRNPIEARSVDREPTGLFDLQHFKVTWNGTHEISRCHAEKPRVTSIVKILASTRYGALGGATRHPRKPRVSAGCKMFFV